MARHLRWRLAAAALAVTAVAMQAARGGEGTPGATVKVPTKRGTEIVASVHEPAKPNGVAVVIAPGQGYHRELPLIRRCAEGLAAAGFRALRFDWAYFTAKGQPSEGQAAEADDLEAAIGYARKLPGVEKVVLAGKSLGSMVALARASAKSDDLAGLVLLTLPIERAGDSKDPGDVARLLAALEIPTLVVCGDRDPLCDLTTLYTTAAAAKVPPRLVITPGDHGLSKSREDPSETDDNVRLAVEAVVLWTRRFTGT